MTWPRLDQVQVVDQIFKFQNQLAEEDGAKEISEGDVFNFASYGDQFPMFSERKQNRIQDGGGQGWTWGAE